jgi:hypothetical protein
MRSASLQVIRRLAAVREMALREVDTLVPKITNDHRDYYELATLIKSGYVDLEVQRDGQPLHLSSEMMLSINLYMWVKGRDDEFEYMGIRSEGADLSTERLFATSKAYLYLDELRSKRNERLWTIGIAIATAAIAAVLGGLFG